MRRWPSAIAALKVTKVTQVERPSSATYGAEQINGIAYAGGDLYYTVEGNDNKLYQLTLSIYRSESSLRRRTSR